MHLCYMVVMSAPDLFPGLPQGEGRPGTHCEISRHSGNSNTESIRECHGITGMLGNFGACANSVVPGLPSPAEGLGERG